MRVLLVEDDKIIGDGLCQGLRIEGYAMDWVEDKESAETALSANPYDMLILDIGLPDGSGIDLLNKLRQRQNTLPVLILTAYDDVSFKVSGLDAGADDYLVKPFELDELLARLRALRRRREGRAAPKLTAGDIVLDPAAKTVNKSGRQVDLGAKEFAILQLLLEKKGKFLSRAQIEDGLYGWDMEIESNTVEVHIHGLRKKLGKDLIRTIRSFGYKIEADD